MPQALKGGSDSGGNHSLGEQGLRGTGFISSALQHTCSSMWMPIFNEKAHPALDVSTNAILKIRKISETAKFRFLLSACGENLIEQGLKFDGQRT